MTDLIRDAPVGQLIRYFTRNKYLQYPEEKLDSRCPSSYAGPEPFTKALETTVSRLSESGRGLSVDPEKVGIEPVEEPTAVISELATEAEDHCSSTEPSLRHAETAQDLDRVTSRRDGLFQVGTFATLAKTHTRAELEAAFSAAGQASLHKEPTRPIVPMRTSDGTILVDWYTTDDQENPQNWSSGKKGLASLQIYLYTLAVYMGSAIYAPSAAGVVEEFGVSIESASFGLSLYVLAYGIGPLVFSPLSEIPVIGRNPPYMITMALFVILAVPTALVKNFGGLLVLRFLQGFFGSPCLATGGASLGDIYSLIKLPYVLCIWALSATCGPALGPIISGFSVTAENWRWAIWEMLWLSGPIYICMLLFLPETSSSNILLRRAARLRKITGDHRLRAQSEIDQANMSPTTIAYEALVRPMQLIFMDPSIGFTAGYVALIYGIFYSFFEAFPLVYIELYGFNVGEMGLTFLSIVVGVILAMSAYYAYVYYVVEPDIIANGLGAPERRLIPALFASMLLPVGLFLFGWTGNGHIHWIVSIIGVTIFLMGVFTVLQCVFVYLPLSYPQYAASLFAGNDFARSSLAFAAIMFSRPMYLGMGIGSACSMLAALCAGCVGGIFVLYFYGAKLRAKSRFAAK